VFCAQFQQFHLASVANIAEDMHPGRLREEMELEYVPPAGSFRGADYARGELDPEPVHDMPYVTPVDLLEADVVGSDEEDGEEDDEDNDESAAEDKKDGEDDNDDDDDGDDEDDDEDDDADASRNSDGSGKKDEDDEDDEDEEDEEDNEDEDEDEDDDEHENKATEQKSGDSKTDSNGTTGKHTQQPQSSPIEMADFDDTADVVPKYASVSTDEQTADHQTADVAPVIQQFHYPEEDDSAVYNTDFLDSTKVFLDDEVDFVEHVPDSVRDPTATRKMRKLRRTELSMYQQIEAAKAIARAKAIAAKAAAASKKRRPVKSRKRSSSK
jgi:hypothetical protein